MSGKDQELAALVASAVQKTLEQVKPFVARDKLDAGSLARHVTASIRVELGSRALGQSAHAARDALARVHLEAIARLFAFRRGCPDAANWLAAQLGASSCRDAAFVRTLETLATVWVSMPADGCGCSPCCPGYRGFVPVCWWLRAIARRQRAKANRAEGRYRRHVRMYRHGVYRTGHDAMREQGRQARERTHIHTHTLSLKRRAPCLKMMPPRASTRSERL